MITRALAAACVALLIAASLLWWRMDAATERAATAEQSAQINAETAEAWRLALTQQTAHAQATDKLLAESRQAQRNLRNITEMRIKTYEDDLNNDVSAADWDAAAVPAAVARRMCEYTARTEPGADTLSEAAGRTAAANTDTACGPSNGSLWRWAERLVEALESANADKAGVRFWVGLDGAALSAPVR